MNRFWLSLVLTVALIPKIAFCSGVYVTADQKGEMQNLLDQYGTIYLYPNTDYRTGGLSQIVMSSGQTIRGGWNSTVPQIVIPGGVSNITIDSVNGVGYPSHDILFTGGTANNNCVIVGGLNTVNTNPYIGFNPGAKINRLRVTYFGGFTADFSTSGYMRNSTFMAGAMYNVGPPILFKGNNTTPSFGNAILGIASTTNGYSNRFENVGDLWVVGHDCESWNGGNIATERHCFVYKDLSALRGVGPTGGTSYSGSGAMAEFTNVGSVALHWPWGKGGTAEGTGDFYFDNVATTVLTQASLPPRNTYTYVNDPAGAVRANVLYPFGSPPYTLFDGVDVSNGWTDAEKAAVLNAYLGAPRTTSPKKPALHAVDDQLGADWQSVAATQPDSGAAIQQLIDSNHIVSLPAGVYYLDAPLRVGSATVREGIIGADKDQVYLVAKGNFPVIQGRGDMNGTTYPHGVGIHTVFENLTIYGGNYGMYFSNDPGNLGESAQINWSRFANLKFMKQSLAGVRAYHIYGFDNNLWYQIDFTDSIDAVSADGTGASLQMTYADKQYFVKCQYLNLSGAGWAWKSIRASGGNPQIDAYFKNVANISRTRAANNNIWVNSVFQNITGAHGIEFDDAGGTSTTYLFAQVDCLWKGTGPTAVTRTASGYAGTLFIDTEFRQTNGTIVDNTGTQVTMLWNSKITGAATLGNPMYAELVNSSMGDPYDKKLQFISNGVITTVDSTLAAPYRQVLAK